jgi:hypothetical protein
MDDFTLAERATGSCPIEIAALEGEARPANLAGSTVLVVIGMHRSGTSALTGMLHHLGVSLGDRLMAATPDNPRGYWEHRDVVAVHERLMATLGRGWDDIRSLPAGFETSEPAIDASRELMAIVARDFTGAPLWGLKDPRLCRLLPLWQALFDDLHIRPRFILALRHPRDVVASLAARDSISPARAELLWLGHVLEAERLTRGQPRVIVRYEELIADWRLVAARIAGEFGLAWPRAADGSEAAIDAFMAPELRRQRASDTTAVSEMSAWVGEIHAAFCHPDARLGETCDAVRHEFDRAGAPFMPLIVEAGRTLAEVRAQLQSRDRVLADLTQRLTRSQHEADELRALAQRLDGTIKGLKQVGGAITVDGNRLPQPLPVEDAFPRWIAGRASIAAARADWVTERVAIWPRPPTLALGMIVPAGNEAQVALTLRSLLAQNAGDWLLHVAAEGDMPAVFAGEARLVWHREPGAPAANLTRQLCETAADWVALIDAGDQLAPHALFSVADAFFRHPEWSALYSDEARINPRSVLSGPHFKPDFNLDLMRGLPYVGALLAVRRELFAEIGGFDPAWDGTEEYDLALRLAERLGAEGFGHVADILYHRLTTSGRSRRRDLRRHAEHRSGASRPLGHRRQCRARGVRP